MCRRSDGSKHGQFGLDGGVVGLDVRELRQGGFEQSDLGARFEGELSGLGDALGVVTDGGEVRQGLPGHFGVKDVLFSLGEPRPVFLRAP